MFASATTPASLSKSATTDQVHRLRDEPAGHPDIDGGLLPVTCEYPDLKQRASQYLVGRDLGRPTADAHLDPSHLERVNRVGHAFL